MKAKTKTTLLYILLVVTLTAVIVPSWAYFSAIINIGGDNHVMVELIFDKLDAASVTNGTDLGNGSTFLATADWGTAQNPYIINKPMHVQNLSVLSNSGFFEGFTETVNGVTRPRQPYFLVCTTVGWPVAIDCNGLQIDPVGSESRPFTGVIMGAFSDGGSAEYKDKGVSVSTIANLTVTAKTDQPDIGFFGNMGYYGTFDEGTATVTGGYAARAENLLFADVTISSQKSWLQSLADWWNQFITGNHDHENLVDERQETHHVGIVCGHANFATLKNISVYYSDGVPAFDLKSNATGSNTNYYSSTGLLGLLSYVNPTIEEDGTINGDGGVSDNAIMEGTGGGGEGGISGNLTGYMLAETIFKQHEDLLSVEDRKGAYPVTEMKKSATEPLFESVVMRERETIGWNNWEYRKYFFFRDTIFTFAMSMSVDTNSSGTNDSAPDVNKVDYVCKLWDLPAENETGERPSISLTDSADKWEYTDAPDAESRISYRLTAMGAGETPSVGNYYALAYRDSGTGNIYLFDLSNPTNGYATLLTNENYYTTVVDTTSYGAATEITDSANNTYYLCASGDLLAISESSDVNGTYHQVQLTCATEVHTHDSSCYGWVLNCNDPSHGDDDHIADCYDQTEDPICGITEHSHNQRTCYTSADNFIKNTFDGTAGYINVIGTNKTYYDKVFYYQDTTYRITDPDPTSDKQFGVMGTYNDDNDMFTTTSYFGSEESKLTLEWLGSAAYVYTYPWEFNYNTTLGGFTVSMSYRFNYQGFLWQSDYSYGWAKFKFADGKFSIDTEIKRYQFDSEDPSNADNLSQLTYSAENKFILFKLTTNQWENGDLTNSATSGNIELTPKNIIPTIKEGTEDQYDTIDTFDPSQYVLEYQADGTYKLAPIESYMLNSGQGQVLTELNHIVKLYKATSGNYSLNFSETGLGNLFGDALDTNSGGVIKTQIGTVEGEYAIPAGMIAFHINEASTDNPSTINIIVAINPEQAIPSEIGLWKLPTTGTLQKDFSLDNPDQSFKLPISKTAVGSSDISHLITVSQYWKKNMETGEFIDQLEGPSNTRLGTYYTYLGGDVALVFYSFNVTETGAYLIGSKTGSLSVSYFSVTGAAGAGNDGLAGSMLGDIDFVYEYDGNIITIDKKHTGDFGLFEEDYHDYYPSYYFVQMIPDVTKDSSGNITSVTKIQNETIYIRREIDPNDNEGIARHFVVSGHDKANPLQVNLTYKDDLEETPKDSTQ